MNLGTSLGLAERAARAAGDLLLSARGVASSVTSDLPRDVKLRGDVDAEEIIIRLLRAESAYPILSEERGTVPGSSDRFRWIVDPLDGSVNYSRAVPLCAVSIALWTMDEPVLGVVYDFNHDEMFTGIVGEGTECNGRAGASLEYLSRGKAILCTGLPAGGDFSADALGRMASRFAEYRKVRMFGSAALSLAYVAMGRVHAYVEEGIRLWDVAAGLALVKSAGGVARWDGTSPSHWRVAAACSEEALP